MSHKSHLQPQSRIKWERQVDTRNLRLIFLIVCEGKKTEPYYFKKFGTSALVVTVKGEGCDPLTLVNEAISEKEKGNYDRVWCVFDRDNVPAKRFREAINTALRNNLQVAYSNRCFELWYLLHFQPEGGMTAQDYIKQLTKHLGHEYQKNSKTIYAELEENMMQAIKNAKSLLKRYNQPDPYEDNPSTTVHLLVEELFNSSRR